MKKELIPVLPGGTLRYIQTKGRRVFIFVFLYKEDVFEGALQNLQYPAGDALSRFCQLKGSWTDACEICFFKARKGRQLKIPALQENSSPGAFFKLQNVVIACEQGAVSAYGRGKYRTLLPHGLDLTVFYDGDLLGKPEKLLPVMGHKKDLAGEIPAKGTKLRFQLKAKVAVQCGKWLVQKDEFGTVQKDAPKGQPLLLPRGKLMGLHVFKARKPHFQKGLFDGGLIRSPCAAGGPQVLQNRHMGKEGIVFKKIAHPAFLRRQVDPVFGIEKAAALQKDPSPVRPFDAGDAFEGQAFAGTRSAQKPKDRGLRFKAHLKMKTAEAFFNVHEKAQKDRLLSFETPFSTRFRRKRASAEIPRFRNTHFRASPS